MAMFKSQHLVAIKLLSAKIQCFLRRFHIKPQKENETVWLVLLAVQLTLKKAPVDSL